MLFPTVEFALFLLVALTGAWLLRDRDRTRLWGLVGASYLFYAWWDVGFAGLLAASTLFNWALGHLVHRATGTVRKRLVVLAVAGNLGVLGVFKYADFFLGSLNAALASAGLPDAHPLLGLAIPVAVSFFSFHGISYVVDVHRGALEKPADLPRMLLYISFFPQLVAGPIVRAAHFLPQLDRPAGHVPVPVAGAVALIVWGLFKKIVIADQLSRVVDPVFADPAAHGAADVLAAVLCYAVQIYCDFSAYSDIAIAVAALFGYRFPRNFDRPYAAAGLRAFWRRWHISLGGWLRDYLYIPLGGDAGGWRTMRNTLIVMLLGGLWHGAAWTFVFWGLLHGLGLAIEHRFKQAGRLVPQTGVGAALWAVPTFLFVCLGWVFFRSPDFVTALAVLGRLGDLSSPLAVASTVQLGLAVFAIAVQWLPRDAVLDRAGVVLDRLGPVGMGLLAGIAVAAIAALGPDGVAPFIYFQF